EEEEDELFRSTLGLVPLPGYPKRREMLSDCEGSIGRIIGAADGLRKIVEHINGLEAWREKHHRPDPSLRKAVAYLEQTIKNIQKIESMARKTTSIVDRASAGGDKTE